MNNIIANNGILSGSNIIGNFSRVNSRVIGNNNVLIGSQRRGNRKTGIDTDSDNNIIGGRRR
jgi:hypothetical protein